MKQSCIERIQGGQKNIDTLGCGVWLGMIVKITMVVFVYGSDG
jgi:hypothetical protein